MSSDAETDRLDGRKLKSASAQEDYDARPIPNAPSGLDPSAPTVSSPGQVGAAPVRWGWWAIGLAVSIGIWWLIARALA